MRVSSYVWRWMPARICGSEKGCPRRATHRHWFFCASHYIHLSIPPRGCYLSDICEGFGWLYRFSSSSLFSVDYPRWVYYHTSKYSLHFRHIGKKSFFAEWIEMRWSDDRLLISVVGFYSSMEKKLQFPVKWGQIHFLGCRVHYYGNKMKVLPSA